MRKFLKWLWDKMDYKSLNWFAVSIRFCIVYIVFRTLTATYFYTGASHEEITIVLFFRALINSLFIVIFVFAVAPRANYNADSLHIRAQYKNNTYDCGTCSYKEFARKARRSL